MTTIDFVENYWLWVTKPAFYDGNAELDPNYPHKRTDTWWTCHKDTKKGDLILLYRTSPRKDIKYLFRATSDAREHNEDYKEAGWEYICDFEPVFMFKKPVTLQNIRNTPYLHDWGAYRANFRRQVFMIPEEHFYKLLEMISSSNNDFKHFSKSLKI